MQFERITFPNGFGQPLAGRIDFPLIGEPLAFALYAHCFTCSKNLRAIGRITETLARHGIATLRFDFTGLGESEGDFSFTNFSSSVEDFVLAARYLEEHFDAPELVIGHSLGGAVAVAATRQLDSVRAVVTVAAPAEPTHIKHHITDDLARIEQSGEAEVTLANRPFTIRRQLLDDIESVRLDEALAMLRRPLLVFHSPVDKIVDVENAAEILRHARHPKSFISLDRADHMVSDDHDARYIAEVLTSWAN